MASHVSYEEQKERADLIRMRLQRTSLNAWLRGRKSIADLWKHHFLEDPLTGKPAKRGGSDAAVFPEPVEEAKIPTEPIDFTPASPPKRLQQSPPSKRRRRKL